MVDIKEALEESVKLQSHYAKILNMYDGGHRVVFKNSQGWIDRLNKLSELEFESTQIEELE